MKDCRFIQKIDEYVLKPYRTKNILSNEVERYFKQFSNKYNLNQYDERDRLLFCVCECFLNFNDREKLEKLLKQYCGDCLGKDVDGMVSDRVESLLKNKFLEMKDKQYSKLSIMTFHNFLEILGQEYGEITLFQFTEEKSVKVSVIQLAIELLKIYIQQMNNGENIIQINIKDQKIKEKDTPQSSVDEKKDVVINNNYNNKEEGEEEGELMRNTRRRKRRRTNINKHNYLILLSLHVCDSDFCIIARFSDYSKIH